MSFNVTLYYISSTTTAISPRLSICLLPICLRVSFQFLEVSPLNHCVSSSNFFTCLPPMSPRFSQQSLLISPRISFKCFSFDIHPWMIFNALSPLTMLQYYFHYLLLEIVLPPQCLQIGLCVSFQYLLLMSSNVSPYFLPKYLLLFFHGSPSNVSSYLLQMFLLWDFFWNDV